MLNVYRNLIGHSVLSNVVLALIVVMGAFAINAITKESEPKTDFPLYSIEVVYPGADPEEVEEGVTRKIEARLDGMQGVKEFTSISRESFSFIRVEIEESEDFSEAGERIRTAIDSISTFPHDIETPQIEQIQDEEEVKILALWGDIPERQMKVLAEEIRQELQASPKISRVFIFNSRSYEITAEVSTESLQRHGLTMADITKAIRQSSLNASSGELKLKSEEVRLRTLGKKYSGEELSNVVVKATPEGDIVRLGHIASITDGFTESERFSKFNGENCVLIEIEKSTGEDAIEIADAVDAYLAKKAPTLPEGIILSEMFDATEFIKSQLSMITKNGLMGLLFVLIVLWLFLEARLAFWVAMGIPISLAGPVVLLWLNGSSLNQISTVAMIVVMGIIVDDAIVAGEAIFVHRRMGKDPLTAAVDGIREVGLPIFASVLTTMIAFAPMLFIPGIMGQFIRQMPLVVIMALAVSLIECIFLLPAHLKHRSRRNESSTESVPLQRKHVHIQRRVAQSLEGFVKTVYAPFVRLAVRYRYLTMCCGASLIIGTAGLVGGGLIEIQMWPAVEGDLLDATFEFPPGTPHKTIEEAAIRAEQAAYRMSDSLSTVSGAPILKSVFTSVPSQSKHSGRVLIQLIPSDERGVSTSEIRALWHKEMGLFPGAISQSIEGESIGMGDGTDVSFWLTGDSLESLRGASEMLKEKLRSYSGVYQIEDNFKPGKSELHIIPNESAEVLGLSTEAISQQLHSKFYGDEAIHLQRGREEVDVRVRLPRSERESLGSLEHIRIKTPLGKEVPLLSVASIEFNEGVSQLNSVNGVRGLRVTAVVDRAEANSEELNRELSENFMDQITLAYPGVTWSLSGTAEDNQALLQSLQRNAIISLMFIFIILATIFRSYIQPIIIMIIIPYGLVGAVLGHMLLGMPLSFLSIGGIVALAGVLVNDSIVLVERINTYLAEGMKLEDAVCKGGERRFRAIFLTSISTCVGLAPLIMETALSAQIVIPMAVSLASGVAFGTMLTLILVPSSLMIMNDFRRIAHHIIKGTWTSPEAVEPRSISPDAINPH